MSDDQQLPEKDDTTFIRAVIATLVLIWAAILVALAISLF